MKKKNILTAAVSLSLVAVIGVGATLAYFTDTTDTATNVFTTGQVDIELIDETDPDAGFSGQVPGVPNENGGITYTDVMPGDNLSKIVGATIQEGSQPCWLGFKVDVSSKSTMVEDKVSNLVFQSIQNTVGQTDPNWYLTFEGNTMYCYRFVETAYSEENPQQNRVILFSGIQIPGEEWGNEYAGARFSINVKAAAVQAANLPAPIEQNETVEQLKEMLDQA